MFYWLTALSDGGDVFNLFRYITFRAGGAFLTALVFGFIFGRPLINALRRKQGKGQPIRSDGPEGHFAKAGTPTMGGLLIVGALTFSTLLWARLDNPFVWMVLFVTLSFAAIGFADDYAKVSKQNTSGVSGKVRILLGITIAAIAAYWAAQYHPDDLTNRLAVPIFKDTLINLGLLFVPFAVIVIVGSANAVNLTDGLDGLAIMPVMIAAGTFGVIAYAVGRVDFTQYLDVHYVPDTGELLIFTMGLIGGGLGFLWYNAPPCRRVHGRHRITSLGRRAGGHRRGHQARDRTVHRRRPVRGRGFVGDHSGALFQTHRQTGVPDGPDPPSLRKTRLVRTADRDPVLDHRADPCDGRSGHAEGAVIR